MPDLERIRLSAPIGETSALLAVESASLLDAVGGPAWWMCHDEGPVESMISLLVGPSSEDGTWSVMSIRLRGDHPRQTDAEALARVGDQILVIGSTFGAKAGAFDARRAFIARFDERTVSVEDGSVAAEVIGLDAGLVARITSAIGSVDLLASDAEQLAFNIEGAGITSNDLLLGLRWPVSAEGDALIVRLEGATKCFAAGPLDDLAGLDVAIHVVDTGAGTKRPEGIRGLSVVDGDLHVLTGQTERDLAARKIKAGASRHLVTSVDPVSRRWPAREAQRFEGFRKVEALAPMGGGGWLYALDDEDAIVLLVAE